MLITFILALNAAVFVFWNYSSAVTPEFMQTHFLVSWEALLAGRHHTLVTSVFSHNQFFHFLLNMLVLHSFGAIMQNTLGTLRFLFFYFSAGVFSSLAHAIVSAVLLDDASLPALGASGALSGLILLFSLIYPREKLLFFGLVPMPAIFGALLFIGIDIWGLTAQASGGGLPIGHGAHLGGSFIGLVYYLFFYRRRSRYYYEA